MSPSTKSKPESPPSRATGDEADKPAEKAIETPRGGPLEIELEVSRQRAATMTVIGFVVGAILIAKLGTVGVWAGVVLLVIGAFRAWELVQSFLYPPGTIRVTDTQVTLPRGLSMPRPVQVHPSDIGAVYFLRRSVPWNRSAPVLVVEVGDRAMAFPRDWFASEADQRHVIHALTRTEAKATDGKPRDKVDIGDGGRGAVMQMVGGVVLIGIGIGATLYTRGSAGGGGQYALWVGPIVAGLIFMWRGFARW